MGGHWGATGIAEPQIGCIEALRAFGPCVKTVHAPFTAEAAMPMAMMTRSCGCASLRAWEGAKRGGLRTG